MKITKKEMKLYCAQLVECGRGLTLAEAMPEGSEPRKAAERVLNNCIDEIVKQLELTCSDTDFEEIKEYLEDGKPEEDKENTCTATA